jgi:hypothetical protein
MSDLRSAAQALLVAFDAYFCEFGVEHYDECPEDDTCDCRHVLALNTTHAALTRALRETEVRR